MDSRTRNESSGGMTHFDYLCAALFFLALWGMGSMESQIKELKRKVEALEKQIGGKN